MPYSDPTNSPTFFAERRREFERRRKAHYREFEAVKLARKLIQEEDDDDDDDDAGKGASGSGKGAASESARSYASGGAIQKQSSAKATTSASTSEAGVSSTAKMDLEPSHN